MSIQIIGTVNKDRLYCTGSLTKLLTTYVVLSFLAKNENVAVVVDDPTFLTSLCNTDETRQFLQNFQRLIGSKFSIRDVCTYYSGLPYTFDLAEDELYSVEAGHPFKHHAIADEITFLMRCRDCITPVYQDDCKFHYSELGILFLGYFIEKAFNVKMEDLYREFILDPFHLTSSTFSRTRVPNVYIQDLSANYDYPSIAILDHGYFCYSNGFYTTLNDMKTLLENLLQQPAFHVMSDIKKARAASPRLLNGMAVEIRLVNDDIIYGYEGLSFSGCNLWAYSTKKQQGYVTFNNSEEAIYPIIYDQLVYTTFDKVPQYSQTFYDNFIKNYDFNHESKDIPILYQGDYRRVNINDSRLDTVFKVSSNFIIIRDPTEIRYDITYIDNHFCILGKDKIHGEKVGFYEAESGNRYMMYNGTLYKKI